MNSKNLHDNAEEIEFLSADEKKLSECVGSLEIVSAPNDFDFRVKSRIAAAGKESSQSGNWQWVRYLLPVGASAFVLAFVLYGTSFFAPSPRTEEMAVREPAKSDEVKTLPAETPSNMTVAVSNTNQSDVLAVNSARQTPLPKNNEDVILVSDRPGLKPKDIQNKPNEDNNTLSRDSTVTMPLVNLPKGLNSNTNVAPLSQKPENLNKVNEEGMLNALGLETVSEAGKLKVRAVQQNSVADRSGVRTGDIIESLDEQKIDANSNSGNSGGIRTLTVLRDGKITTIELKVN